MLSTKSANHVLLRPGVDIRMGMGHAIVETVTAYVHTLSDNSLVNPLGSLGVNVVALFPEASLPFCHYSDHTFSLVLMPRLAQGLRHSSGRA